MASGFSGNGSGICDGLGCKATSGLTFYLSEKRKLCHECATKTGSVRKERKGKPDLDLFCEKHDKPVTLYCQNHELAVCQICAINDHQEQCQLGDVHVSLENKRSKLLNLNVTLHEKQVFWKGYGTEVSECRQRCATHIKSVEKEVNYIIENELVRSRENEDDATKRINVETDEEIRKVAEEINKKREARLQQCHEAAEKLRQPIEIRRRELLDDVIAIARETQMKIEDLQRDARDVMQRLDEAALRMEFLLEDETELMNGAHQLITSLTDILGKTADDDVFEHITSTVKGVRFIEGNGNAKYSGRIGGYNGKWELSSTLEIPSDVKEPCIVGYTSNADIIISDHDEEHTYCFNVMNGTSQRVITSDGKTVIASCALLDEDTIVCGKYLDDCTGESLPGCISLNNRQWELIRYITLPRNTSDDITWMYAAVATDGMIIAAESDQKCVYVINPSDGCVVNTIMCEDGIAVLRGVLATGDIVALPCPWGNKLLIIDRQGVQRYIKHSEEILNCGIDTLTDDLYVVYWDEGRKMVVIDQMSRKSHQEKVEATSFPLHELLTCKAQSFLTTSNPVITASGELVVCNGRECLVFKNMFTI